MIRARGITRFVAVLVAIPAVLSLGCSGTDRTSARVTDRSTVSSVTTLPVTTLPVTASAGCGGPASDPIGTDMARTIEVAGVTRTYRLSVPEDPTRPAPLILALHGMGSSGEGIDSDSGLPARATAAGAVVVSPDAVGTPTMWRPGSEGPDADLLDALIADVTAHRCIDTSRIGIVGFSVGAVFAALYGCAHRDRIAAIVTVEVDTPGPCTAPMPVMAVHGTADPVVPYSVPPGSTALGGGSGTESNLTEWARISACAPAPEVTDLDGRVSRLTWSGCADGSDVVLFRITGGRHEWPPADGVFDATEEAVAFLLRHPRR